MARIFDATIGKICRKDVRNFLCVQVLISALKLYYNIKGAEF